MKKWDIAVIPSDGIGKKAVHVANINVNGKYPSMFEPVHGSAPDIYGKGIANPIGQIWAVKLVLDHFGEEKIGAFLLQTIEDVTADGVKTPDLGGAVGTLLPFRYTCCQTNRIERMTLVVQKMVWQAATEGRDDHRAA
ncbi:isocitrate/isopropylmalate dehydrogenase family protein [Geobacillus kaustophilus]|uniref:Isocitrate/isopropylmalate dehydrogenase family protein n=1 Tax=Geobacillus kaustophilus TaxID=1462 RepID=A0A0D8BZ46_GEOKU|nr:isocitrate/isopropylmalate dehydrogenase family protein [Geobacillus kaustophilus]